MFTCTIPIERVRKMTLMKALSAKLVSSVQTFYSLRLNKLKLKEGYPVQAGSHFELFIMISLI